MGDLTVKFQGVEYDAAKLLAALHNNTRPVGLGLLHAQAQIMTQAQAESILVAQRQACEGNRLYPHGFVFDYVLGRPIKVKADADLVIDEHSQGLYDRDAGEGAFARALAEAAA
jgi:hypothetical protein